MESKNPFNEEAVSKLLKGMKREEAPENFVFNLMTRIENKNFGDLEKEDKTNFLWMFIPSASIVTAAVVVLIFLFNGINSTNSLNSPQVIHKKAAKTYVVVKNKPANKKSGLEMYKILQTENDVVINKTVKLPVNGSKSLPVDKYLNSGKIGSRGNQATLVSEELTPYNFDGFIPYTEARSNSNSKAVKDSLNKKGSEKK